MNDEREDREAIEAYREKHGEGPFLAADAVVTSADGRILMVRRSAPPQKGRLALPGGFLGRVETLLACALRELAEETGLRLEGDDALPHSRLLRDAPGRDPRARIVSAVFHFPLSRQSAEMKVRGGDDAASASWVTLDNTLTADEFYADHHAILDTLGLLPVHQHR